MHRPQLRKNIPEQNEQSGLNTTYPTLHVTNHSSYDYDGIRITAVEEPSDQSINVNRTNLEVINIHVKSAETHTHPNSEVPNQQNTEELMPEYNEGIILRVPPQQINEQASEGNSMDLQPTYNEMEGIQIGQPLKKHSSSETKEKDARITKSMDNTLDKAIEKAKKTAKKINQEAIPVNNSPISLMMPRIVIPRCDQSDLNKRKAAESTAKVQSSAELREERRRQREKKRDLELRTKEKEESRRKLDQEDRTRMELTNELPDRPMDKEQDELCVPKKLQQEDKRQSEQYHRQIQQRKEQIRKAQEMDEENRLKDAELEKRNQRALQDAYRESEELEAALNSEKSSDTPGCLQRE